MRRLACNYQRFIQIIEANGFTQVRHGATSHRLYSGTVSGEVRTVTVAFHNIRDEVKPGTLKAMIRQCGLSQSLFRR